MLFLIPALVPVTSTEKEQELEAGKFNAVMPIILVPGSAIISASQLPTRLLALATTRPAGKVSLAAIFINITLAFGLVNRKVRVVVPFSGMLAVPNPLAMVGGTGGGVTVKLAVLLVAPGPLSLEVIGPVVLLSVPKSLGAFTFTVMKQAPWARFSDAWFFDWPGSKAGSAGASVPPIKLMEEEPGVAVTVPPQSLLSSLGDAITRPTGKLSANAIPVSVKFAFGSLFGLLMVKLNKVVPFVVTLSVRRSLLIVGGKPTPKVADAELPMPPLVELTVPVLLRYEPTTELVTFTLTVQKLLIGIAPPVRETLPEPTAAVAVPPQVLVRPLGLATTRFAGKLSVNA